MLKNANELGKIILRYVSQQDFTLDDEQAMQDIFLKLEKDSRGYISKQTLADCINIYD